MTGHNDTIVRTSGNIRISADEQFVLQRLFERYARVAVETEFGMGLSGCRVFRVRPVEASGVAHTPALVKIGPIDLINKEWVAYETRVRNRLPRIAWVTSEPIVPSGSTWGGLRFELVGGGIFKVQSLSQYYRSAGVEDVLWVLQKRLFPVMGRSWWLVNRNESSFQLESDYDQFLPVNLMIGVGNPATDDDIQLVSPARQSLSHLTVGDHVRVVGFQVTEVDAAGQQLTLNLPDPADDGLLDSLRLRIQNVPAIDRYQVGSLIEPFVGTITATRYTLIEAQARKALGEDIDVTGRWLEFSEEPPLPNPLHAYRKILHDTFLQVHLSTIHGDFNLENILVDPDTRDVQVIDFATVRQGHALHDLLRLETEVVTKLIPEVLTQTTLAPRVIRDFYHRLHQASFGRGGKIQVQLPYRDLEKPFALLVAIRQEARKCFFYLEDHAEYYDGLILYLLGALKFNNLDDIPNAKALSFLAAAATVELLDSEPKALKRSFAWPSLKGNKASRLFLPLLLLVGLIYLALMVIDRPEPIPVGHLCELDNAQTVDIEAGTNLHPDLDAYFEAANPNLYEHLATVERTYLERQEHKGLTYISGSPGVGKSFVSTRRLRDEFPGDRCLIKLGDLDDLAQLSFEVIRKPDLTTLDDQISFDELPAIADAQAFDLDSLFSASGCKSNDGLVPLIIIDDLDEVHSETSKAILRSINRFILEVDLTQQKFVQIVVLGRSEGFAPWYQDPERYDDDTIVPILATFRLQGPEFLTLGDIEFLADNENSFLRGEETWQQMKQDGRADEYVKAYVDAVTRHPFLTYSIRALASASLLADRALTLPDDTEVELKNFMFQGLLGRAANVHGRPLASDDRYLQILEEIAAKYAGVDQVDNEGFFSVSDSDTVQVMEDGQQVGELSVRDALDHSGIAILQPFVQSTTVYRFEPVWVHAHLVELHNLRQVPGHEYQSCYQ